MPRFQGIDKRIRIAQKLFLLFYKLIEQSTKMTYTLLLELAVVSPKNQLSFSFVVFFYALSV